MKHLVWPPSYISFLKSSSECFKNNGKAIKHCSLNSKRLTVLSALTTSKEPSLWLVATLLRKALEGSLGPSLGLGCGSSIRKRGMIWNRKTQCIKCEGPCCLSFVSNDPKTLLKAFLFFFLLIECG